MGIKVAKFGGSSVSDASQLVKVKRIVESDKERRYIVVSAPGKRNDDDSKITDLLYLCKTHIDHNVSFDQVFSVVYERFKGIEKELGVDVGLDKHFNILRENLIAGCSIDYLVSRGEYFNAILIAAYLGFDFVDPTGLILFDVKGHILYDETNEALEKELHKHKNAVLPGFYGSHIDGNIKTFSRGGSDISGALVAKAVKASIYENWTDVSGFLMADPRIVKNPKPIKVITYKELRELSYMGATVLHEDAIFPVRQVDIPINIRNTNEPEHPGTIILSEIPPHMHDDTTITGVAGRRDFTVIGIYKDMMNSEVGFVKKILSILEEYDISFEHLPSGIDTVSVVISNKNLEGKLDDILEDFEKKLMPDTVEVNKDMALIATVGLGMARKLGVSSRLFTALYEANVNVRMIDQGSSEMNIIVGVENSDFEKAIKAIYKAFVEKE
ncbi:MAG: aspartate kinase [Eubacteriales bacterium]